VVGLRHRVLLPPDDRVAVVRALRHPDLSRSGQAIAQAGRWHRRGRLRGHLRRRNAAPPRMIRVSPSSGSDPPAGLGGRMTLRSASGDYGGAALNGSEGLVAPNSPAAQAGRPRETSRLGGSPCGLANQ
jgi:hypothetical protein